MSDYVSYSGLTRLIAFVMAKEHQAGRIVNGHMRSLNRNTYQVSTVGMKFSKILKVLSFDLSQILSQSKHLDWCLESKLTSK